MGFNLRELSDLIEEKWRMWLSIILVLVPGIMYQIQFKDLSQFGGTLFFIPIMASFYYSLPSLFIALFMWRMISKKKFDEEAFFSISVLTAYIYLCFNLARILIPYVAPSLGAGIIPSYILVFISVLLVILIVKWGDRIKSPSEVKEIQITKKKVGIFDGLWAVIDTFVNILTMIAVILLLSDTVEGGLLNVFIVIFLLWAFRPFGKHVKEIFFQE